MSTYRGISQSRSIIINYKWLSGVSYVEWINQSINWWFNIMVYYCIIVAIENSDLAKVGRKGFLDVRYPLSGLLMSCSLRWRPCGGIIGKSSWRSAKWMSSGRCHMSKRGGIRYTYISYRIEHMPLNIGRWSYTGINRSSNLTFQHLIACPRPRSNNITMFPLNWTNCPEIRPWKRRYTTSS